MEGMKYFYELYERLPRGGPGDNVSTRRAFELMKDVPSEPLILDIGCGPGMQTLELARLMNGRIIALDNHQPFLDKLMQNAREAGLSDRIDTKCQSMLEMDFEGNTFDVIWSEGALYFMGFKNGLEKCKQLLKSGGNLAVTEIVYLQSEIPDEVKQLFDEEYPVISDIEGNIGYIDEVGLTLLSHFTLPSSSWLDNYYKPMEQEISSLKKKYVDNDPAISVFDNCLQESDFYQRFSDYYGYEFFIMHKID